MEKKTIGSFISALRKSNGLTQKDLADKLGVSDKAVSRWERDDYAPDISLIPVIAEIFGVTSDEVLRGERILVDSNREESGKTNAKTMKQIERLLKSSMDRFNALSIISVGISLLGLLVAMAFNFAFLKMLLAFFVGCTFYLVAIISESVFFSLNFSKSSDDEFEGEMQNQIKMQLIRRFGQAISINMMILAFSLPMLLKSSDLDFFFEGTKISLGELFFYGVPLALIGGFICMIIMFFVDLALIRNGVYTRTPEQARIVSRLRRLKAGGVAVIGILVIVTTITCQFITHANSLSQIADGIVFYDLDEAKAYLTQGLSEGRSYPGIGFSDDDSNMIFECEYDPEKIGNILSDRKALSDDILPLTVYSRQDTDRADRISKIITACYFTLIVIEVAAGFIIYFIRRARVIRGDERKMTLHLFP